MAQWISLGLGVVSLAIFGHAIKQGMAESDRAEATLHTDPGYVGFLAHDSDLKHALQRMHVNRKYHPQTFDTILWHCNALLGVQLLCEAKQEGYRAYASRAQEHNMSIVIGLDVLSKWIAFETRSVVNRATHFEECRKEILAKCDDYMHNIRLVVHN